jgi:hypothetical protein
MGMNIAIRVPAGYQCDKSAGKPTKKGTYILFFSAN